MPVSAVPWLHPIKARHVVVASRQIAIGGGATGLAAACGPRRIMIGLPVKDATDVHPNGRCRTLVMDVLPASFPWVRHLPAHEMRWFSVELVETLGAAAELDNSAAVAQLVTGWKATAEVYADPELR